MTVFNAPRSAMPSYDTALKKIAADCDRYMRVNTPRQPPKSCDEQLWALLMGERGALRRALSAVARRDEGGYGYAAGLCRRLLCSFDNGALDMERFKSFLNEQWQACGYARRRLPARIIVDTMCRAIPALLALGRWYYCISRALNPNVPRGHEYTGYCL